MSADVTIPKHLKIVGWSFIFVGFLALIETLYQLFNAPVVIPNFLLVFIFVGFGLLKRKKLWRSFAISCSFVVLIFTIGNVFLILSGKKSLENAPMDVQIILWIQLVLGIAVSAYALWALQSKPVRAVFEDR